MKSEAADSLVAVLSEVVMPEEQETKEQQIKQTAMRKQAFLVMFFIEFLLSIIQRCDFKKTNKYRIIQTGAGVVSVGNLRIHNYII